MTIFAIIYIVGISYSQVLANAYSKNGKIHVLFENGDSREIVSSGDNMVVTFSRSKNFVVYTRLENKSAGRGLEGVEPNDQLSFWLYDIRTGANKLLFTTCLDGEGGTTPDYGNSSIFPMPNLCGINSVMLSPDESRLFFQTEGWATSPAVHYYNLKTHKLVFFKAGWLQKITSEGIEVQIVGADFKSNQGHTIGGKRFFQYCLFDSNGILIKELSPKEY